MFRFKNTVSFSFINLFNKFHYLATVQPKSISIMWS